MSKFDKWVEKNSDLIYMIKRGHITFSSGIGYVGNEVGPQIILQTSRRQFEDIPNLGKRFKKMARSIGGEAIVEINKNGCDIFVNCPDEGVVEDILKVFEKNPKKRSSR
ncbi:MAG: hypothetical protein GY804_06365 [Alphaproteobacteria bacterium]|nr:hypothetical protein [Alphaproteobacteria bacterium]